MTDLFCHRAQDLQLEYQCTNHWTTNPRQKSVYSFPLITAKWHSWNRVLHLADHPNMCCQNHIGSQLLTLLRQINLRYTSISLQCVAIHVTTHTSHSQSFNCGDLSKRIPRKYQWRNEQLVTCHNIYLILSVYVLVTQTLPFKTNPHSYIHHIILYGAVSMCSALIFPKN